jgi:hypothetical protein
MDNIQKCDSYTVETTNVYWNIFNSGIIYFHQCCFNSRSILILSTHICLGLPSGLLPSRFPTHILYLFLFSIRATCPAHIFLLAVIILITLGEQYKRNSSLCSFLHPPITSKLFGLIVLAYCITHSLKRAKSFLRNQVT